MISINLSTHHPLINRWLRAILSGFLTFFALVWLCFFLNPFFASTPIFSKQKENQNQIEKAKPKVYYRKDINFFLPKRSFFSPDNFINFTEVKTNTINFTNKDPSNIQLIPTEKISWWTILALVSLSLLIPKMPCFRLNLNHLKFKNHLYAPSLWTGVFWGWITSLGYLYFWESIGGAEAVLLFIPFLIWFMKNYHDSAINTADNGKYKKTNRNISSEIEIESLFNDLDSAYKNHENIKQKTVSTLFLKIKDWFSSEIPVEHTKFDVSGTRLLASKYADDLLEAINNNKGLRIGITGAFGCGKSSFINLILACLKIKHESFKIKPIYCKVNMWGCRTSAAAQEFILESILNSVASFFDTSSLDQLPQEWRIVMKGYDNLFVKICHLLWMGRTFEKSICELSDLLKQLKYHLILIIEDIDRFQDKNYKPKQIQPLLEQLKKTSAEGGLDCTILISGKETAIDFSRFSDLTVSPLQIPLYTIKKLIWATITAHLVDWPGFRKPEWIDFSLFFGHENTKNSPGSAALYSKEFSLVDFQLLLPDFRTLKKFLRKLDSGWKNLEGEIDYFDFFLIILLKVSCPDIYDFLHSNHHIILSISSRTDIYTQNKKKLYESTEILKHHYQQLRKRLKDKATLCDKILVYLFGDSINEALGIDKDLVLVCWYSSVRQRIKSNPFPTDYWWRAYSGLINPNEVSDSKIIREHNKWCTNQNKNLIEILKDELVDCKWASLKLELTNDQVLNLTSSILFERYLRDGKPILFNVNYQAGGTAESSLNYLRYKSFQSYSKDPQGYTSWAESTCLSLIEKSLVATIIFFNHWINNKDAVNAFPSNKFKLLKYKLMKTFQTRFSGIDNPHEVFLDLIPEADHQCLRGFLGILSLTNEDMIKRPAELIRPLKLVPGWLSNLLLLGMKDSKTTKKTAIQSIGCLFKEDGVAINNPKFSFIDEHIKIIFPKCSTEALEKIIETDLSGSHFEIYKETIHENIRKWISKNS